MAIDQIISTILKHDSKVTSYKIALLRSINDVVLSFPGIENFNRDVAIPLNILAEFWVAYYWPFMKPDNPILQGRGYQAGLKNDVTFRPALTELVLQWETLNGGVSHSSDGYFVMNEMRVPRKRATYPLLFQKLFDESIKVISRTIEVNPIRYAGTGEWSVFGRPVPFSALNNTAISIPGTRPDARCVVITSALWKTFQAVSLWVEALCIHEWSLLTEQFLAKSTTDIDRGTVYKLLTTRPDNRRPLTWERNNIEILFLEGKRFICPWTQKPIYTGVSYDLDHLLPVSIYPINELWNLIPADPDFNSHKKRNLLPSPERLSKATPDLILAYSNYEGSKIMRQALREDVSGRFILESNSISDFPELVAGAVVEFIEQMASSRNLVRF